MNKDTLEDHLSLLEMIPRDKLIVFEKSSSTETFMNLGGKSTLIYVGEDLHKFIVSTGKIFYWQNSHYENLIMIDELIRRIRGEQ